MAGPSLSGEVRGDALESLQVRAGEILAGKYRIEQVLGQGGMGVVVSAVHLQLDERVAIKFLLPSALQNEEAVARFAREARAAVKIKSEHVARVTDVGTLENGCPYMVMEYLHGADLGGWISERGPLPLEEAVDYVLQAAEAIAEAHSIGIIHRDLKPANLFRIRRADGSPCVKVLDFGISKVTGLSGSGADLGMTRTTTIMGSPLYMSPEQMSSSRDVDVRTDIWALGVILYELLAGRVPFSADTMPQLCAMILQQPAPPLRNVRPDIPEGLQLVLLRCMEKDPRARYANVAKFAEALLPYASRFGRTSIERIGRVLSGTALASDTGSERRAATAAHDATQAAWGQTSAPSRRRAPLIVLGLVVAIAAGAALWAGTRRPAPQDNATQAEAAVSKPALPAPAATLAPPTPSVEPTVAVAPSAAPAAESPTAASAKAPSAAPQKPRVSKRPAKPAVSTPPATSKPRAPSDLYSDRK